MHPHEIPALSDAVLPLSVFGAPALVALAANAGIVDVGVAGLIGAAAMLAACVAGVWATTQPAAVIELETRPVA